MDDVEIELQALITQREAMLQIMNRVTSEEVFKRYSEELVEVAKSIRALKSRRRPLQNTGSPKLSLDALEMLLQTGSACSNDIRNHALNELTEIKRFIAVQRQASA